MISISKTIQQGGRSTCRIKGVAIKVRNAKRKTGAAIHVSFTIDKQTLADLRWINGDRVDVLWDMEKAEGQLVRLPKTSAGWAVSICQDKPGAGRVSLTVPTDFGFNIGDKIHEYIVSGNSVHFRLSK